MIKKLQLPILAIASASIIWNCDAFVVKDQLYQQEHSYHSFSPTTTSLHSTTPREGSLEEATQKLGSVPYGETSRKYRRTVFRHNDWVEHRSSSSRILDNLQSIFFSGVVRQLRPQVTAVTTVAVFVFIWNYVIVSMIGLEYTTTATTANTAAATSGATAMIDNITNEWNLKLPLLTLPTLPFTLSSPALGLLLVFRTNAAYFRWMTSRDAWARMIVHAKNLIRMTNVFSTDDEAVYELSKVVWLYCRSVMNKLSSPDEDEQVYMEQVTKVFQDSNKLSSSSIGDNVMTSSDRVTSAWKEMSIQLHSLPTSDPKALIETDKSIIILGECTSICEKIYSSPVPLVYTRHTARYLSVWALLLPCALYSSFSGMGEEWATVPASAVISFFLFGVDELAMQLEEPFSILPMQVFCDDIYESNNVMVGKEDI